MKINVLFFSFYIIDLKIYSLYLIAGLSTDTYLEGLLACNYYLFPTEVMY